MVKITSPGIDIPEGLSLDKRKLFSWLKPKKQSEAKSTSEDDEIQASERKQTQEEIIEKPKEEPIKEYNETLYSKGSIQKQLTKTTPEKKIPMKRMSWENAETIGEKVDRMHQKDFQSTQMKEDTNKKVDYILLKKKR